MQEYQESQREKIAAEQQMAQEKLDQIPEGVPMAQKLAMLADYFQPAGSNRNTSALVKGLMPDQAAQKKKLLNKLQGLKKEHTALDGSQHKMDTSLYLSGLKNMQDAEKTKLANQNKLMQAYALKNYDSADRLNTNNLDHQQAIELQDRKSQSAMRLAELKALVKGKNGGKDSAFSTQLGKDMAKEAVQWELKDRSNVISNIADAQTMVQTLLESPNITGGIAEIKAKSKSIVGGVIKDITGYDTSWSLEADKYKRISAGIGNLKSQFLKPTFGGNISDGERKAMVEYAFDPQATSYENARRIKQLAYVMEKNAEYSDSVHAYFKKHKELPDPKNLQGIIAERKVAIQKMKEEFLTVSRTKKGSSTSTRNVATKGSQNKVNTKDLDAELDSLITQSDSASAGL